MHPVRRWLGIWLILGSALAGCNATTTVGGLPRRGAPVTPSPTPTSTATAAPTPTPTPPGATASPTARATATPTPTASPTPLPAGVKIYVANHGKVGNAPSVTIYPVAATGDATPLATLAGSATTMQQIQFPAVDASGDLFLSDQGASGSATAGFVSTFAVQHDFGNVAPQSALTGLPDPEGIAFDAEGNVYVATETAILVYPPHPTPASTPLRSITGYYADQPAPYGLTVGPTGKLYVADEQEVDVFAAGASGNALPSQVIGGSNEAAASAINSCLSVALDTSGDIYCANFNNSTITEYAPNANGNATTPTMIASDPTKTSIDEPFAIFIDASNNVYVANYGNSSISIFTTSSLATGQATRRIVGAQTGLNFPYGLWVR